MSYVKDCNRLWKDFMDSQANFENSQAKLDKSLAENETLSNSNAEKCKHIEGLENQKSETKPNRK